MSIFGVGGTGAEGKEANRQGDIARQSQEFIDIINQNLAQLIPGSEEYSQLNAFGEKYLAQIAAGAIPVSELGGSVLDQQPAAMQYGAQLVSQQQQRIAGGGAASPLQSATNQAAQGLKDASALTPIQMDIQNILSGKPTTTPLGAQYLAGTKPSAISQELLNALQGIATTTPEGQVFTNAIGKAANPTVDDTVFQNLLKQVEDSVNTSAAGRGILGGGLRLEQMGRTGVEAATQEGLRQDALQQQAYENAKNLFDTGQQTEANVQDFSGRLFDAGQDIQSNQQNVQQFLTNLQLGRETGLTAMMNNNNQNAIGNQQTRLADQSNIAQNAQDFYTQLGLNQSNALMTALSSLGGGAIGTLTGNPAAGAAGAQTIAAATGAGAGGAPTNLSGLLGSQQSNASQNNVSSSSQNNLSRQNQSMDPASIAALMKLLASSGGGF